MNVFLVDSGHLYKIDSSLLSKRVHDLQIHLSNLADIPLDKQVLLTYQGRSLDPKCSVYQFVTEERPLFLFSKSNIECHVVQTQSNLPVDPRLQEKLDRYLNDGQNCETLKAGADLAADYQKYSEEIYSRAKQLVQDQQLQRNGWAAVINNLDGVTAGFNRRVALFHDLYESFLQNKEHYSTMLVQFEEDVKVLSQIPLAQGIVHKMRSSNMLDSIRLTRDQGLGITESMRAPDPGASPSSAGDLAHAPSVPGLGGPFDKQEEFISLLHWIEAQDTQNSLRSLVMQCSRAMDQINNSFLPRVEEDVEKVKMDLQAPGMRDIRGLEERLLTLQNLILQTEKICEEQAANANTIRSQQENFMAQGDVSVLSDLITAHREQLQRLHSNNRLLIQYHAKFANAKVELCQNLLIRLTWVMHCQKNILNSDGRLTMVCENLTRVKRRFAVLEQINIAPRLYCMCLGEVARRNTFSSRYKSWAKGLISKVTSEHTRETEIRCGFYSGLKGHFLMNLFRGLDSLPTDLVASDALSFDDDLFDISEDELARLSEMFPSYSSVIKDQVAATETATLPTCEASSQASLPMIDPEMAASSAESLARCLKLEEDLQRAEEREKNLTDINDLLEESVAQNQEEMATLRNTLENIKTDMKGKVVELEVVKEERATFQKLACEKDARISTLKSENETFKLQSRGWKNDKKELQENLEKLERQLVCANKSIADKDEAFKSIQREVDLVRSNQTITEQHRQQLTNLRLEIEHKKDKEKTFELEKLRLEKDKIIQELERNTKLDRGQLEETIEKIADDNSKKIANLSLSEAKVQELTASLDEYKELLKMAQMESERDLKNVKTRAAEELTALRETYTKQLEEAAASTTSAELEPVQGGEDLSERVRQLEAENKDLRTLKGRCMEIAVTQFQRGDHVIFYYDESKCNYLVANVCATEYQYFLHPDNLGALGLSLEGPSRKPWAIGVIKDKEFCQARKQNNRFKVPEGRKFYRVYAQQRASTSSTSTAAAESTAAEENS